MTPTIPPSTPHRKQLVKNSLASYARFLVACLVLAAMTPWIVESLGVEAYGVWVLLMAVGGYLELLDMGLMAATVKFVGSVPTDDLSARRSVVATLFRSFMRTTLLTLVVAITIFVLFANFYPLPQELRTSTQIAAVAVALRITIQIPGSLAAGILSARERLDWVQGLRAISLLGGTALQIGVLNANGSLAELAICQMVIAIAETAVFWILAYRAFPEARFLGASPDLCLSKTLNHFSKWSVVLNVSAVILSRTDPLLIGLTLPLAAVTLYSVPLRIAEQLLLVAKQSINCFSPIFARLHREGRRDELTQEYRRSLRQALSLALGLTIPTMWFSADLLSAWMGPEFRSGATILSWLLLAVFARTAQEVAGNLLGMTGAVRLVALGMAGTAVLNVALSLVLLQVWGSEGVAAATFVATGVSGTSLLVWHTHRFLGTSLFGEAFGLIRFLAFPGLLQVTVLAISSRFVPLNSLATITAIGALALFVYLGALAPNRLLRAARFITIRIAGLIKTIAKSIGFLSQQGAGTR